MYKGWDSVKPQRSLELEKARDKPAVAPEAHYVNHYPNHTPQEQPGHNCSPELPIALPDLEGAPGNAAPETVGSVPGLAAEPTGRQLPPTAQPQEQHVDLLADHQSAQPVADTAAVVGAEGVAEEKNVQPETKLVPFLAEAEVSQVEAFEPPGASPAANEQISSPSEAERLLSLDPKSNFAAMLEAVRLDSALGAEEKIRVAEALVDWQVTRPQPRCKLNHLL